MLYFRSYTQQLPKKGLIILTLFTIFNFSGYAQEGLSVGDTIPQFTTIDHSKDTVNLKALTDSQKVVVIFYRGYWCPFCQRHISILQDSLFMISDSGATVVLISPENHRSVNETIKKTNTKIRIISDTTHAIGNLFKVNKQSESSYTPNYNQRGSSMVRSDFSPYNNLPVPACYIISKGNIVTYRYFNKDYRYRVSVRQILNNL